MAHTINPLATVHLEADNHGFRAVSKSARGPVQELARTLPATGNKIGMQAPI